MTSPFIEELQKISERSFEMARLVLDRPEARADLAREAAELQARLDSIYNELEVNAPEELRHRSDLISESMLDLNYASRQSQGVSLRLNREINRRSRS